MRQSLECMLGKRNKLIVLFDEMMVGVRMDAGGEHTIHRFSLDFIPAWVPVNLKLEWNSCSRSEIFLI